MMTVMMMIPLLHRDEIEKIPPLVHLLSTYTSPSSANNTAFGSRSSSSSARGVFETVLFEQTRCC
jgi:hypothetical protein